MSEERPTLDAGWRRVPSALTRAWTFRSFSDAMAFANRVAELAERMDHHPDLAVSYRRVSITWSTHETGGVTSRDEAAAAATDQIAFAMGAMPE